MDLFQNLPCSVRNEMIALCAASTFVFPGSLEKSLIMLVNSGIGRRIL